jgi:hypothetical protein
LAQETVKFGRELPSTVEDALEMTARQRQDFWRNAIEKEMAVGMVVLTYRSDDRDPCNGNRGPYSS